MKNLSKICIGIVVLLHIGFFIMEMFLWLTPTVRENFALTLEQATLMAPLAANMGLYNGFLASGLVWGLLAKRNEVGIKVFFLICIIIAGIYGAVTIKHSILYFQAFPAVLALFLVWLGQHGSENDRIVRN